MKMRMYRMRKWVCMYAWYLWGFGVGIVCRHVSQGAGAHMFSYVFHRCLGLACASRRMSQKCECADVFACVFHRCLIKDSWMVACVGVYVCVHISMYRLCGSVEG